MLPYQGCHYECSGLPFKIIDDTEMPFQLRSKANELWETIVRLETEKYDLEERQKRQDYDVSILLKIGGILMIISDF